MRLWHQYLIPYLDNKRLLGQHRECCALRGSGWGRKHSAVNYVFDHHVAYLIQYHTLVMSECIVRGFKIDNKWYDLSYRGKNTPEFSDDVINGKIYIDHLNTQWFKESNSYIVDPCIYKEHDISYLRECLLNLKAKNAELKCISIDELLVQCDLHDQPI